MPTRIRHHGSRRARLPQLQHRLPRGPLEPGRGLHRDADPEHRGPALPDGAGRPALPRRHPDPPRGGPPAARPRARGRRGGLRLQRRLARDGHAQGLARARLRRGFPAARPEGHHAEGEGPGRARSAPCARAAARARRRAGWRASCARRAGGSSPSATRCPTATSSRQKVQRFADHARTSTSTSARSRRWRSTSRTSTTGVVVYAGVDYERHPARGREGGRRHPLGRRQQRPAVLPGPTSDRRRRPAPPRPRAAPTTRARPTCAGPTSS